MRATNVYINSNTTNTIAIYPTSYAMTFSPSVISSYKDIIPYTGYLVDLGSSSIPWDNLYCNSTPFVEVESYENYDVSAQYIKVASCESKGLAKISVYGNNGGDHAAADPVGGPGPGGRLVPALSARRPAGDRAADPGRRDGRTRA